MVSPELEFRLKTPQAYFHLWVLAVCYTVGQEGLRQSSLYLNQRCLKVNDAKFGIWCSDTLL